MTGARAHATTELLRAHVDGDPDAFAELVRRHRDRLWAVALRTIGDREEAADALQDALLSAHRAAARFRGDSAVTTWLHRIVVNACLDRIRRRQAHPTVPLPDGSARPSPAAGHVGGVEPAAPATDHDTALVVREALAQLPAEQRAALVLVDVQGYSGRRGGRDPRRRRGHDEEPVRPGPGPAGAAARPPRGPGTGQPATGTTAAGPQRPNPGATGGGQPAAGSRPDGRRGAGGSGVTGRDRHGGADRPSSGCPSRTSTCSPTTSAAPSTAPPTRPRSPAGRRRPGLAQAHTSCWPRRPPRSSRRPARLGRRRRADAGRRRRPAAHAALADAGRDADAALGSRCRPSPTRPPAPAAGGCPSYRSGRRDPAPTARAGAGPRPLAAAAAVVAVLRRSALRVLPEHAPAAERRGGRHRRRVRAGDVQPRRRAPAPRRRRRTGAWPTCRSARSSRPGRLRRHLLGAQRPPATARRAATGPQQALGPRRHRREAARPGGRRSGAAPADRARPRCAPASTAIARRAQPRPTDVVELVDYARFEGSPGARGRSSPTPPGSAGPGPPARPAACPAPARTPATGRR